MFIYLSVHLFYICARSAWATGEEAAVKRELLHDRFEVTI